MAYFRIINATSGHSFGIWKADDKAEAIATLFRCAGEDVAPSEKIEAREVYALEVSGRHDATAQIQERLGSDTTEEDADAVFYEGQLEEFGSSWVWWVRDWDTAVRMAK